MANIKKYSKPNNKLKTTFKTMLIGMAAALLLTAVYTAATASLTQNQAFAAQTTDDNASTKVTIQAATDANPDDQFIWEAPVLIPFVARSDGSLICPDASAVQIKNLGACPIRIKTISFAPTTPWNIVSDADNAATTSTDVLQFNIKSNNTSVAASDALKTVNVSEKKDFYMAAKGNNGANLSIATEGKMLRSTQDLAQAKGCGSITWTVDIA